jgi:C4-dicarboxylate-specific signal transduction histidine kinase
LFIDRIHPEDRQKVEQVLWADVRERRDFDGEYRLLLPDGSVKYLHSLGECSVGQSGDVEFIGAVQDVTQRRLSEKALARARAELAHVARITTLGELTASIAHEINQPLTAVVTDGSASLRWLGANPPNLDEAREAISRAITEAKRASDVIARIRAMLRNTPPQMDRLNVNAIIREVLALAENELLRGGVTAETELAGEVPYVLGDRVQLQQVVLNLIMNAIDAMTMVTDRQRKVIIRSARRPDGVLIQVQDSGAGLDAELVERVFEPFFTTKPQGIGMGLSIGRSIVEAHGGRLWAMSGSSQGAVFQFILPEAAHERAA